MKKYEWLRELHKQCEISSQGEVCRALRQPDGFPSKSVICLALHFKYPSKKGLARLQSLVEGAYMNQTVDCPILGELGKDRCQAEQLREFSATNRQRVQLYKACRSGCINFNQGDKL